MANIQNELETTREKGSNKFLYFIIAVAIFTWFFFVFPPIFILMYNENTLALYMVWAIILLVLIAFLGVLYSSYKVKNK